MPSQARTGTGGGQRMQPPAAAGPVRRRTRRPLGGRSLRTRGRPRWTRTWPRPRRRARRRARRRRGARPARRRRCPARPARRARARRASAAASPRRPTGARSGRCAAKGLRHERLEVRAVIEQRVVPGPGVVLGAGGRHERRQLAVGNLVAVGEQLVQEHRAHVRLDVHGGAVVGERHNARRRGRTDARKRFQLLSRVGQQPSPLGRTRLGRPLERERAAIVPQPLPLRQHVGRACGRQGSRWWETSDRKRVQCFSTRAT